MGNVETAISIDAALFLEAEQVAVELQVSRSALYTWALRDFLRRRDQDRLTEELNAAYDGTMAHEDAAMFDGMRERRRRMAAEDRW